VSTDVARRHPEHKQGHVGSARTTTSFTEIDGQWLGNWEDGGGPAALVGFSVSLFTFALVGTLIASRHPRNSVGWILMGIGFSWALDSSL
jgi:hypothetical protein